MNFNLALPPRDVPPLGMAPLRFRRFHVGNEIRFEDMVPGEPYYRKFIYGPYGNMNDNYDEFILVNKERDTEGNLTGSYSYQIPPPTNYYENYKGEPMTPVAIPQAPLPPGVPNPLNEIHREPPGMDRFYKVAAVQRGRHLLNPLYKEKRKKELRRKHLNMSLNSLGFSTNVGTGPSNLIRKYLNLQPPRGVKGTQSIPRGSMSHEKKQRKTRKNSNRNKRT